MTCWGFCVVAALSSQTSLLPFTYSFRMGKSFLISSTSKGGWLRPLCPLILTTFPEAAEGNPPGENPAEGNPAEGRPPEGNTPEDAAPQGTPIEGIPPKGNPAEGAVFARCIGLASCKK